MMEERGREQRMRYDIHDGAFDFPPRIRDNALGRLQFVGEPASLGISGFGLVEET